MTTEDYYSLLGIERDVSPEKIKKAYRKMAVKYHPDKNKGDANAEEMFKKVSEAYEVLKDPEKRAAYDRYGHAAFQQGSPGGRGRSGGFHDPFDIFREVFGGGATSGEGSIFEEFFGRTEDSSKGAARRGSDLRYDLEVSLGEATRGLQKEISYRRSVPCEHCNGAGAEPGSKKATCRTCNGFGQVSSSRGFFSVRQVCPNCKGSGITMERPCKRCGGEGREKKATKVKVKIPAGVDTGSKLRSTGKGEAGIMGGHSGDLYIVVHVREHEIFERHGDDLFCEIPIKFTLAALGGTIEVPTLTSKASLKIPAGTQSGTTFRIRGHGMPSLRGGKKGDQMVRIHVEVPKKLSPDQRQKLEDFALVCGDAENPVSKSFLDKAKRFFE